MKRVVHACLAAVVLGTGLAALAGAGAAGAADEPPSAPGQLLVGYEVGASGQARAEARSQNEARLLDRVVRGDHARREVELVGLPPGANRDAAVRRFEANPNVAYAEPNWVLTHSATSNDPYYTDGRLWGLYGDATTPANQYGSQAGETWVSGNTGHESVVVGVIDEGIDYRHPDLADNIWTNPFDPADGVDNDGNGYVDDVHGWDFYYDDDTVYDGGNQDKHGTHVAGTIAGVGNNGAGVAGVAWDATMVSLKFLGPNGGFTSGAVKAVRYLTDLKTRHGLNVVASNNSWGGGGWSDALYEAIEEANASAVLFVAAAGNGGGDGVGDDNDSLLTPHYPSNYPNANVVAVASITSSGSKSTFSNYGATTVDLGAPGSGIYSTLPGNTYGSYSGTSMATPHVTGAAVLAAASGISPGAAIKDAILDAAVPTASLAGTTVTNGRLDVSSFVVGSLSVDDVLVVEGDAGTTNATFTVMLSPSAPSPVTVDFATSNGTATAGSDYATRSGTLSFEVGVTTATISVPVNADATPEADETFFVDLSQPSGANIADGRATATIRNDDNAVSVNDVTVTETATGTLATFSVTVAPANPAATVTVDYATADGSATAADGDYVATSGSLTFTPGSTQRPVAVPVKGDTRDEPDESFFLRLSNPANALIGDGEGQATIRDDDAPPVVTLSINDVTVNEGNVIGPVATFRVSLSHTVTDQAVSVDYMTADASATAPSDYTPVAGTLVFKPYTTALTVSVPVNSDLADEPNEAFFVNLVNFSANATAADGQGVGTIVDDDATPTVSISIDDVSVSEGGESGVTLMSFPVRLSAPTNTVVSVNFATADGTATVNDADYVAAAGTVVFNPGVTTRTITVEVLGDMTAEADEFFLVNLSDPSNALIADNQATGTILRDEF